MSVKEIKKIIKREERVLRDLQKACRKKIKEQEERILGFKKNLKQLIEED